LICRRNCPPGSSEGRSQETRDDASLYPSDASKGVNASSHPNSSFVDPEATLPVFRTVATNSETAPGKTSAGPTMSSSNDGVAGRAVEAGRLLAAGNAGDGTVNG
jgi:hypothetical protein